MRILTEPAMQDRALKQFSVEMAICGVAFIALYFPVITAMIGDWESNPNFSHGYFIPFISAVMIYSRRRQLQEVEVEPCPWGALLVGLGLLQYFIAFVGAEFFLQRSSMVVVLLGLAHFLGGWPVLRQLFYPIAYLLLMIPIPAVIWSKISFPMQLMASSLAERVVSLFGVPIFREGNVLYLAETTLEVVDACSGLRSLTTMVALSLALIYFSKLNRAGKGLIFVAAFPIAIIINIFRLTVTALMASRYGEEVAQGFLHDFSGWLTFVLGLCMLWGITEILERRQAGYDRN